MWRTFPAVCLLLSALVAESAEQKSLQLLSLQCQKGSDSGCVEAAMAYYQTKNPEQARQHAAIGCKRGNRMSCMTELSLSFNRPLAQRIKSYCEWGSYGACLESVKYMSANAKNNDEIKKYLKALCYNDNDGACKLWSEMRLNTVTVQEKDKALAGCKNKNISACYEALDILSWEEIQPVIDLACALRIDDACARKLLHTDSPFSDKQKARAKAYCTKGIKPMCEKVFRQLDQSKRTRLMVNACENSKNMCGYMARFLLEEGRLDEAKSAYEKACTEHSPIYCYYKVAMTVSRFDGNEYENALSQACDYLREADSPICGQYLDMHACRNGDFIRCSKLSEHLRKFGNKIGAVLFPQRVCESSVNPKTCFETRQNAQFL